MNEKNVITKNMTSNCAEHPVNAVYGVTGISDNMKDMPPIDMPGVTGDVVNVTQGHTHQDLGEAGGVINTNPSQIDIDLGVAGGVVNTNPSHMSIDIEPNILFTRISKSELALLQSDAELGRKIKKNLRERNLIVVLLVGVSSELP